MRLLARGGWLVLLAGATACAAGGLSPRPTPELIAAMPDTIACDRAVLVDARTERQGVAAERHWLDAYYPRHSPYAQALRGGDGRRFDVLTFTRGDGRRASVCFDITAFYGRV